MIAAVFRSDVQQVSSSALAGGAGRDIAPSAVAALAYFAWMPVSVIHGDRPLISMTSHTSDV